MKCTKPAHTCPSHLEYVHLRNSNTKAQNETGLHLNPNTLVTDLIRFKSKQPNEGRGDHRAERAADEDERHKESGGHLGEALTLHNLGR